MLTLVFESRLMSLSVLYDLMYPVSVLTNVLSILDTFNTGVTTLTWLEVKLIDKQPDRYV